MQVVDRADDAEAEAGAGDDRSQPGMADGDGRRVVAGGQRPQQDVDGGQAGAEGDHLRPGAAFRPGQQVIDDHIEAE